MDKQTTKQLKNILAPPKKRKVKVETLFYMEGTHVMPDGTIMSGKKHSKYSKNIKKKKPKPKAKKSGY